MPGFRHSRAVSPDAAVLLASVARATYLDPIMVTKSRFLSSARMIAGLTLVSRSLGLAREWTFSYFFGTAEVLSAFRIAFQIPNLTRRLFGEGALSSAMIPILTRTVHEEGEEASRRLVGAVLVTLALVLGGAIVAGEAVVAGWRLFADDAALSLTGLLLPYAALVCTVAVIGGVLNVRGHFATPAILPSILNLGIILGIVGAAKGLKLEGAGIMRVVCIAVLLAGLCQLAISLVVLKRHLWFPIFRAWHHNAKLREVMTLMGPMALGLSAVQINTLADNLIAYWFVVVDNQRSGPAILGFAHFLYQLPLGVFGIAIATAVFPALTKCAAEGDRAGLALVFERGIRTSLFLAVPASAGLAFVARPLMAALYEGGRFDAGDTARCSTALVFYSAGLAAYFAQHVVVRTFYARQDSGTPARVALVMVAVNLGMNLALVQVLEESGLALATAICAFLQVGVLLRLVCRSDLDIRWSAIGGSVGRTVLSTLVMAGLLVVTTAVEPMQSALQGRDAVRVVVMVVVGVGGFVGCARVLGQRELADVLGWGGRAGGE